MMRNYHAAVSLIRRFAAGATVAVLFSGIAVAQQPASDYWADWPEVSKKAAGEMYEKYGEPDGATSSLVIWKDAGPWKKVVVQKEPVPHHFPKPHEDVLEQVINYRVPIDKFDELAEFDGSLIAERTKGTLAARCDKEPMNFLALNLAHDVITDKLSVADAREKYADVVVAFMKGEKDPYTQELQFRTAARGGTGDPDEAIIEKKAAQTRPQPASGAPEN